MVFQNSAMPSFCSADIISTGGVQLGEAVAQHAQRALDLGAGDVGRLGVDVGLVDDDQVGDLHDPLLDRLQVVAGIGQLQQAEDVGHAGHGVSDWPTPTVSMMITSNPAASQSSMASRVFSATPPRTGRRARADEGFGALGEQLHARLVAEDGAAGDAGRRIHRQHRHLVALLDQIQTRAPR
jgi:hypothetical protein